MRDSLFQAALNAWAASSAAIVADARLKSTCGLSRANAPHAIQVVSAAPGSWKTTYAKAFAISLARVTADTDLALGCAFLVHHVDTADAFYRELVSHLPGRVVAVWTGEHDVEAKPGRRVRFAVDDLERAPVIIVTHEFFKGVRGDKARSFRKNGITLPRVLTLVDEKVSETVREFIQAHDHDLPLMLDVTNALFRFTSPKVYGQDLERPADDREKWRAAAKDLEWFTTDEAAQYMRSRAVARPTLPIEDVFGFARCVVEDRAFIARQNEGNLSTNFIGFERTLPSVPGMDAWTPPLTLMA